MFSRTVVQAFICCIAVLHTLLRLPLHRAFICFSVFGTPDRTLALVVDILHQKLMLHHKLRSDCLKLTSTQS